MTDDRAGYALESSASEQSELDSLLVKLTTSALGFSVALGVLDSDSPWLIASWCVFLPAIFAVVLSKFLAVEALRAYYESRTHKNEQVRDQRRKRATKLDSAVQIINYSAGGAFVLGASLVVLHMFTTI